MFGFLACEQSLFYKGCHWITPIVVLLMAGVANGDAIRYRGVYTLGHEVNTFCPEINSQCYWLGNNSDDAARAEMQALSAANVSKPYQPLCVVLEGEIDRESARNGFATDYDGLFTATKVLGLCEETRIVTHGDLQHHRWVLQSINGETLDTAALNIRVPDLDFGEQMHVSGNSGCNRFSGQAKLVDGRLDFGQMLSTAMLCLSAENDIENTVLRVMGNKPMVRLEEDKTLILESSDTVLKYRLRDWVQ
jgi:heat shock protein HslJ